MSNKFVMSIKNNGNELWKEESKNNFKKWETSDKEIKSILNSQLKEKSTNTNPVIFMHKDESVTRKAVSFEVHFFQYSARPT